VSFAFLAGENIADRFFRNRLQRSNRHCSLSGGAVIPRVAVTGVGVICGVANSAETFAKALLEGRRGFSRISDPRVSHLRATHAAIVEDIFLSPEDDALTRNMDRWVRLSLFAARQAMASADLPKTLGPTAGIVLGTCSGGMLTVERQCDMRLKTGAKVDGLSYFSSRYYSAAKILARATGASGPSCTVVTACAAGSSAIAHAADLIRGGMCDVCLAGGADSFALSTLIGFDALKATCEGLCSPFSDIIGLNLGEGAGVLVLESMDRAKSRGATVWGEVLGYGLSNDAFHATAPDPSGKGQTRAVERALVDAAVSAEQIEYVNAHGTGTRANDSVESRVIAKVLGERSKVVPVSSTKSMIGHCLGGAGALEAAACLIAAREGVLPPTAGFTVPREGCSLDYVKDAGRPFTGSIVLSNSFGFGGNNACLVMDTKPRFNAQDAKNVAGGFMPPLSASAKDAPGFAFRPVITGSGMVHALGIDHHRLDSTDVSGIGPILRFTVSNTDAVAGLVPEIDIKKIDRRLDLRNMDLCSQYTAIAARLSLEDAAIQVKPSVTEDIGLVLGLAVGPSRGESAHVRSAVENDFQLDTVDSFPYVVQNEVSGHAARALLLKGHNTVFSTGRGAGLCSLVAAAVAVQMGHSKCLIAAAADELTERSFGDAAEARIFGEARRTVLGEGAAAFMIESKQSACDRGAPIRGEVLGWGATTDVSDLLCTTKDSAARAVEAALNHAGISPIEVRFAAISNADCPTGIIESEVIDEMFPNAKCPSLAHRLGFPEAALCLMSLNRALYLALPGDTIAGLSLSQEGVAYAVIVRRF
jgi:3-oxoacyl-[acyl-carrier-protein] synthase II